MIVFNCCGAAIAWVQVLIQERGGGIKNLVISLPDEFHTNGQLKNKQVIPILH